MVKFFTEFSMVYQFIIETAMVIAGAGIALPGGKKWGWIIFGLGFFGMFLTAKYKGLLSL